MKTAKNSLKEGIKATSHQQILQHNNIGFSQQLRSSATDLPPFQSNRTTLLPTYSSSANYQHSTALQAHNQQQQQSVPYDYDGFSTAQPPSMRFQQRNFTQPWACDVYNQSSIFAAFKILMFTNQKARQSIFLFFY